MSKRGVKPKRWTHADDVLTPAEAKQVRQGMEQKKRRPVQALAGRERSIPV